MKTMRNFFALLLTVLMMASCGKPPSNFEGVKKVVTPSPLEVHNGKIDGKVELTFPDGYVDPNAVVEFTLELVSASGATELKKFTIQGFEFEGNNKVIRETGGSTSANFSIEYDESMKVSDVMLKASASVGKKSVELSAEKLADGVIATSELVDGNEVFAALAADEYERITPETTEADVNYLIQSSVIRNSELRAEDIKALKEYLKAVNANDRKEFTGIEVSSYASPDGAEDLNTKVSGSRGKKSDKFVQRELKRAKVEGVEVVSEVTAEDWEGFQKAVAASDIQDKELILRVLSMYNDPAKREEEIKNIAATYKELADEVLPQLRRSQIAVNVNNIGRSDDEINAQYAEDASQLSANEMLYAATLTEDLNKKVEIYKKAVALYPEDWRTYNNLAYAYFAQAKYAEAADAVKKAAAKAKTPQVCNNMGAVALNNADIAKAKEAFGKAAGAGKVLDYNMGIVAISEADYKVAAAKLKGAASNNAALACILVKDYAGASKELAAVAAPNAMTSYLKAVVAARTSKEADVIANLKDAIAKDASLKGAAQTDLEFAAYFENEAFKAL